MREYVARLLAERYDVTGVADGMQALAVAKRRPPDLVISDVMMPMLDGFGLLRELRADPATATIPMLLLSARAGEEAQVEGLEKGADDYLTKPFGARELLARVAAHLELARVRRAAARRERELRDEAESILESITDGFVALDRDWRITYMNAEAERINGRPREELLGREQWELFPATVGTRLEREFQRAVAERVNVQLEYSLRALGSLVRDEGLSVQGRRPGGLLPRRHRAEARPADGAPAGRRQRHVRLVAGLPGDAQGRRRADRAGAGRPRDFRRRGAGWGDRSAWRGPTPSRRRKAAGWGSNGSAGSSRPRATRTTPWPVPSRPAGPSTSPRSPTHGSAPRPGAASTSNSCEHSGSSPYSWYRSPLARRSWAC